MNLLLPQWDLLEEQLKAVDEKIAERAAADEQVQLIETVPGISQYGGSAIQSRIGNVEHFKHADSLANYFGLTPGCRNSGEATNGYGSITKCGSKIVAYLLNQAVIKVLRTTASCGHGSSGSRAPRHQIARVAVMRRLATMSGTCSSGSNATALFRPPRRGPGSVVEDSDRVFLGGGPQTPDRIYRMKAQRGIHK